MKKFIAICALSLSCLFVSAQSTSPRFGTTGSKDNTGRVLTHAVITTTDAAQAALDTITFNPNAYETIFRPSANIQDSVCYKFSSTSQTYSLGDICTFMVTKGTGAGKIKFGGSVVVLSTASKAVAIAASKKAIIRFRFDGQKWIEECRVVEP